MICRGLIGNYEELCSLINRFSPSLVCLQKTSLKNSKVSSFPGYVEKHDTCILMSRSVSHSRIDYHGPLCFAALRVSLNKDVTVCFIYIPPEYPLKMSELDDLFTHSPTPVLPLGEFNGANPKWGSSTSNPRGNLVARFLAIHCLCLMNDSSSIFLHCSQGTYSHIDLFLSSHSFDL